MILTSNLYYHKIINKWSSDYHAGGAERAPPSVIVLQEPLDNKDHSGHSPGKMGEQICTYHLARQEGGGFVEVPPLTFSLSYKASEENHTHKPHLKPQPSPGRAMKRPE